MEGSGSERPGVAERTESHAREGIEDAKQRAESSARTATSGRSVGSGDAQVPVRSIAAITIFVVVFVIAYLITWTVLGGIGLALGAVTGLIAGALAVKLYTDRFASEGRG